MACGKKEIGEKMISAKPFLLFLSHKIPQDSTRKFDKTNPKSVRTETWLVPEEEGRCQSSAPFFSRVPSEGGNNFSTPSPLSWPK